MLLQASNEWRGSYKLLSCNSYFVISFLQEDSVVLSQLQGARYGWLSSWFFSVTTSSITTSACDRGAHSNLSGRMIVREITGQKIDLAHWSENWPGVLKIPHGQDDEKNSRSTSEDPLKHTRRPDLSSSWHVMVVSSCHCRGCVVKRSALWYQLSSAVKTLSLLQNPKYSYKVKIQ